MDEQPKMESALGRWRAVTADALRPVPYYPGAGPGPAQNDSKEKPNFPQRLLRGKWFILGMAILGALVGAYRVISQVPMYAATTTLEMLSPNLMFMGQGRFDPEGPESYALNQANLQTQIRILLGPDLKRRAKDRVTLESPPITPPAGGPLGKLRSRLHLVPQENLDFQHSAINVAATTASARPLGSTKLLEISCESIHAETAAAYVNALASEYLAQTQQTRSSSATRTMQWMSTQIEDAKARSEEADQKLQNFLKTSGRAYVLDRSTVDVAKLTELERELAASQHERIEKQSRFELAKSSPVDSLPEILDDGTLRNLNGKLYSLKQERAQLLTTVTADHIKVKKIDSEIAQLEDTLRTEKGNMVRRIENEYQASLRQEKMLQDAYNKQALAVAGQTDTASLYSDLRRNSEGERAAYNSLLAQYNQMNVIAAVPSSSARIIDTASANYTPVRPKPVRDVSIAVAAAIAVAMAFLVLWEMIRVKKRSRVFAAPGASYQVLNVPELGILPAFETNGGSARARRLLPGGDDAAEASRPANWSKEPFLAESIRHAFASIRARNEDGGRRLFVVTSASPNEGKTTLVGNLGVAMAEARQRVLMVDADLRAPRLAALFNATGKTGLSDIYESETPIANLRLEDYIHETGTPNLFLLSSGEGDAKTAGEMPFSRRMRELFVRLRKEYDYVLIDTPPSIQFSDARLLGQISDGMILVIRSGVSSREAVSITVRRLTDDGVTIVGTILNHWQPERGGAGYGDYFMDGYKAYETKA